ncbi:MAG: PHP domain-containing protein [Firmicutes bacterium]|nr:PHP domain-containing protein [Bacillota bacterium]
MFDLHTHTLYSADSLETVADLLLAGENLGLSVISITDHNSVGGYQDLEKPEVRKLFGGKIVTGVELVTMTNVREEQRSRASEVVMLDGYSFEILGYGIDAKKMGKILSENKYENADYFTMLRNGIYEKLEQLGLGIERKDFPTQPEWNQHIFDLRGKDLLLYENFSVRKELFRKFLSKDSVLGIDISGFYKSPAQVVKWIHDCGGKAFLAHPMEYGEASNKIIGAVLKLVDGIECFHPSASPEQSQYLVGLAQKNNLLISGGSDYHGAVRPQYKLGATLAPSELATWVDGVTGC